MLNSNAQKWVAALRSGDYQQTRGSLHVVKSRSPFPIGYCCLGVACEVYRLETGGALLPVSDEKGRNKGVEIRRYNGHRYDLPDVVREWLNLGSDAGIYTMGGFLRSLAFDNDQGSTFEEIANIIESKPSGLFEEDD